MMMVQFSGRPTIGVPEAIRQLGKAGYTRGTTDKKTGITEYVKGSGDNKEVILVPKKGSLSGTQSTRTRLAYQAAKEAAEAAGLNFFA